MRLKRFIGLFKEKFSTYEDLILGLLFLFYLISISFALVFIFTGDDVFDVRYYVLWWGVVIYLLLVILVFTIIIFSSELRIKRLPRFVLYIPLSELCFVVIIGLGMYS